MKNFFLQMAVTFALAWLVQLFAPWWSIVVIAAVVAMFFHYQNGVFSFLSAFLAVGLLWLSMAYWLNMKHPALTDKIGALLGGVGDNVLFLITALLGGLVAGMSALTSTMGRKLVQNK
jgi:hypothetical protein